MDTRRMRCSVKAQPPLSHFPFLFSFPFRSYRHRYFQRYSLFDPINHTLPFICVFRSPLLPSPSCFYPSSGLPGSIFRIPYSFSFLIFFSPALPMPSASAVPSAHTRTQSITDLNSRFEVQEASLNDLATVVSEVEQTILKVQGDISKLHGDFSNVSSEVSSISDAQSKSDIKLDSILKTLAVLEKNLSAQPAVPKLSQ